MKPVGFARVYVVVGNSQAEQTETAKRIRHAKTQLSGIPGHIKREIR